MKKAISIILAIAMIACMIPMGMVTVSAATWQVFVKTPANKTLTIEIDTTDVITTSGEGGGDSGSKGQLNFCHKAEVAPAAEAPANSTLFGSLEWNQNFSGQ